MNELIVNDNYEVTTTNQNSALFDPTTDNLLYMAEKADSWVKAMNKIMVAALGITTEKDWVLIGGTPYLQESGALKVARLFGISISLYPGYPVTDTDKDGYKTFTYKARFLLKDQFVDCEGSRSMKEDFFAGKGEKRKTPDAIDERDVKMAAYTNCLNNGVKRFIPGLRNLSIETLSDAGLDTQKIKGYTFKEGSQGGKTDKAETSGLICAECGKAITQSVASFSEGKYKKRLCMDCQKKVNQQAKEGE